MESRLDSRRDKVPVDVTVKEEDDHNYLVVGKLNKSDAEFFTDRERPHYSNLK